MKKKIWVVTMRVVDEPDEGEDLFTKEEIIDHVTKASFFQGLTISSVTAKVKSVTLRIKVKP